MVSVMVCLSSSSSCWICFFVGMCFVVCVFSWYLGFSMRDTVRFT